MWGREKEERERKRENKCKKNLRIAEGRFHVQCLTFLWVRTFLKLGETSGKLKKGD